ncbi:MAG: LamG domain-containing protein [Planctomycetes bacterium]|nr:LamG domain-containing protein [Planctomycetota bacterium]
MLKNSLITALSILIVTSIISGNVFAADCPPGQALNFDGTNDYVALPDNDPIWLPQNNFTASAWVYFDRDPGVAWDQILDLNGSPSQHSTNRVGYGLQRIMAGNIRFHMAINNSDELLLSNLIPAKGTWYHIVAVRNGTTQELYIDGTLDNSRTCLAGPIDFVGGYDDNKVNIGRWTRAGGVAGGNYFLDGTIDDVRIYNRTLTASEISTIMYTPANGTEPGLVGYWNFDEGAGQIAHDLTANANHGQLGSTPTSDSHDPAWAISGAPLECDEPLEVNISIEPRTLNIQSNGTWITCQIKLPDDYDVTDVDNDSILLADLVPAHDTQINPGQQQITAKFDRQDVIDALILMENLDPNGGFSVFVDVEVTGQLNDGTKFKGTDNIRFMHNVKPKKHGN